MVSLAKGPPENVTIREGAFEELDAGCYESANQLNPDWYIANADGPVKIYEYCVTLTKPTPAIMGKVAD